MEKERLNKEANMSLQKFPVCNFVTCNSIFASVDPHMVLQLPDIERVKAIQDKIIMCNHTEILSIKCHKDSHYKQYHPITHLKP
jgi:hypothetical protein